jgi:hypothetical protein
MASNPLITSEEAQQLVTLVLAAREQSVTSIIKYYEENPFKPYVGASAIKKAHSGESLTIPIRKKFQKYINNTTEEERLKPLMSDADICDKVRAVLEKEGISTPKQIERKVKKNPFKGYVGKNGVYDAFSNKKFNVQTKKQFIRYFKDNN